MKKNVLFLSLLFLLIGSSSFLYAGPTCTNINAPVSADGIAYITVSSFVTNAAESAPVDVTIFNPYGGVVATYTGLMPTDSVEIAACSNLGRTLDYWVRGNDGLTCEGSFTFKDSNLPILLGRSETVFCDDSLIIGGDIGGVPPSAVIPCGGTMTASFVADWVIPFPCIDLNDTAKIILREYEAFTKDGRRGFVQDTIYVLRFPALTADNFQCAQSDTLYCGDADIADFGPFINFTNPADPSEEITIPLLNPDGSVAILDGKCGLNVHAEIKELADGCNEVSKITITVKQTCSAMSPSSSGNMVTDNSGLTGEDGYFTCEFWLMSVDTLAPEVACDISGYENVEGDTFTVFTSSYDCAANLKLPPVTAVDSCNDVKLVKVNIPGFGLFPLTEGVDGTWSSSSSVRIPHHDQAVMLIIEAFDDCHNVGYDTCYVRVKDRTKPVAVVNKGLNVTISGKKVWVEADAFDEESWDNCAINFVLARRSDWTESCVDFCDDIEPHGTTAKGDTIWGVVLSDDKDVDPVEAHYAKTIEWLAGDGQLCADVLANAWIYSLLEYATVECVGLLDEHDFLQAFKDIHGDAFGDADELSLIGGGWSDQVAFDCDDACESVTVEVLVMDYWCNWSTGWTKVWVEDKTPIEVVEDLTTTIDISCKSYRAHDFTLNGAPSSLEAIVEAAEAGDEMAITALDEILGTYQKAWVTSSGDFVDDSGEELDRDKTFTDSICDCGPITVERDFKDEHFGHGIYLEDIDTCSYSAVSFDITDGVVAVNCGQNVLCDQEIWTQFDECGQGVIYRKFTFVQGCVSEEHASSKVPDTLSRMQRIWVGNACELNAGMFDYPEDVTIESCGIEYDPDGSGNIGGALSPDSIGRPGYRFDDDCRLVGMAYEDKVFDVVGGDEACYKIIRTWYFSDWCEVGKPLTDAWIYDPNYEGEMFSYAQKIVVFDTTGPSCTITPIDDDILEPAACEANFETTVTVMDECSLLSYEWEISDEDGNIVAQGSGELDAAMSDGFDVAAMGLTTGTYTVKAVTTDGCQNEGKCTYTFNVVAGKKPSLNCITSITAELTPWTIDGVDTAKGVVWAEEYIASFTPPCDSDSSNIVFRIERSIFGDGETPPLADSIDIGCADAAVSPISVRIWAVDTFSGTADYCETVLFVQNNMGGCGDISVSTGLRGSITTELNEEVGYVDVIATFADGTIREYNTNETGAYFIAALLGDNVKLELVKNGDVINGVSTADLIEIQKHILGKSQLLNEYREIAADVNIDNRISPRDLIDIRKVILGETEEFENVNSWTFLQKGTNSDLLNVNNVDGIMIYDWLGIKYGDVTMSNDPKADVRSNKALKLATEAKTLKAGEIHQIEISASEFEQILGYQFTVQVDPASIEILNVRPADVLNLTNEHFGTRSMSEGIITTAWSSADPVDLNGNTLFTVELRASEDVILSDVLTINSRVTTAEAYNNSNELLNISLAFEQADQASFALYQNRPNPFNDETTIGFNLPQAQHATISIMDVNGKLVHQIEGDYAAGYNQLVIGRSIINTTGIFYYQIDTDQFTAVKKMLIAE